MNSAKLNELFVVSEDFLSECETISSKTESLLPLLTKHSLAPWGKEVLDLDLNCFNLKLYFEL